MIAKIYRLKSGRILLEIADDMLEKNSILGRLHLRIKRMVVLPLTCRSA